jgi:hypothetical protein
MEVQHRPRQGCMPTGKQPQLIAALRLIGWGRRPSSQQADDPRRAIEIVALTGQLYATDSKRPITTASATQKMLAQPALAADRHL